MLKIIHWASQLKEWHVRFGSYWYMRKKGQSLEKVPSFWLSWGVDSPSVDGLPKDAQSLARKDLSPKAFLQLKGRAQVKHSKQIRRRWGVADWIRSPCLSVQVALSLLQSHSARIVARQVHKSTTSEHLACRERVEATCESFCLEVLFIPSVANCLAWNPVNFY